MRQNPSPATGIAPPPAAVPVILPSVVDRFGELQRLVDLHKPVAAEHKAIKDKIDSDYADSPAEELFVAQGQMYELRVGMKKNEREIVNKGRLKKILGALKVFDQAWTVALGFIDKHVPEDQHKLFLVEERTGRREMTPVLKEVAKAA